MCPRRSAGTLLISILGRWTSQCGGDNDEHCVELVCYWSLLSVWYWMYSGLWSWSISNVVWVPGMGGIVWCGDPAGINIGSSVETVTDTGRDRTVHTMIINLSYHYHPGDHHNIFLTSFGHCIGRVESLRYLKRKEIILLSPFCKSVRPVRTPISHFPK